MLVALPQLMARVHFLAPCLPAGRLGHLLVLPFTHLCPPQRSPCALRRSWAKGPQVPSRALLTALCWRPLRWRRHFVHCRPHKQWRRHQGLPTHFCRQRRHHSFEEHPCPRQRRHHGFLGRPCRRCLGSPPPRHDAAVGAWPQGGLSHWHERAAFVACLRGAASRSRCRWYACA